MSVKVAAAVLTFAGLANVVYAVEHPKIQSTAPNSFRAVTAMSPGKDQAVLSTMLTTTGATSSSRATTTSSALEESNTIGMLLAGLAIMGLVVRRRMN